ncbi:MAG: ThuA domain-containing protein [Bacteroidota bacterium]
MTTRSAFPLLFVCLSLLAGCADNEPVPPTETPGAKKVLIVGGGSSHDFDRWFDQEDSATLTAAGFDVTYTDDPSAVLPALDTIDLLYLSNNQPLTDSTLRRAIFEFTDAGKGLLLIHPSVWYNWEDWPAYNRELVGGGSRSHGPYGPFEITVTDSTHDITAGVPATFTLEDELYRFEVHAQGPALNVLMVGTEPDTGTQFPVAWTINHPTRRIVGITLGHDGFAHESAAYKTLLTNAANWLVD